MDAFNRPINIDALFEFKDLKPHVRSHLAKTYAALSACMISAIIGSTLSVLYSYEGYFAWTMATVCLIGMVLSGEKSFLKPVFFLGFGFCKGVVLGPLISISLEMDPGILITAFLSTSCIFICMSLAALVSKSRSYLYLGGLLGTSLLLLMALSLIRVLGGNSKFILNLELGIGLLTFIGYVIYDTQLAIAKAEQGFDDYWGSAVELFIDFWAIFVRILIILTKDAKN